MPKNIRLDYFIIKIPNKRELQQIAIYYSWDIDFKELMNLYKRGCTGKPYSFLVNSTTPGSDILSFRYNLLFDSIYTSKSE